MRYMLSNLSGIKIFALGYKIFVCGLLFCFTTPNLSAQTTIDECYTLAQKNYPLIKKYQLIEKSKEYSISNANKGYLPQVGLGAKATYQSEVMGFGGDLPINIPVIPKDQYNASITVNQIIWDGGVISSNKKTIEANSQVEKQSVESDLYAIRERVNNLFFGIMLVNEQIAQSNLYTEVLKINYNNIQSYINGGVANNADLDVVIVEQLKNEQRLQELNSNKESYLQMLSYLIGKEILEIFPPDNLKDITLANGEIKRPELALFEAQLKMVESKKQNITAATMPKFALFAEGGYGNPALNILNPGFRTYAIGGVKLSWNFGSFYTKKRELKLLNSNSESINIQKDIFLFNTNLSLINERKEIEKLREILANDSKIIELKENIVKSSQAKAANGTITINDLLKEITSSQEAKQTKILHQVQLQLAIYTLRHVLGDLVQN